MKKLCIVLTFFSFHFAYTQTQLWVEDFSIEASGTNSGTASGNIGGTWSVTTVPANGVASFAVDFYLAGKGLVASNTGSEAIWKSNTIDISTAGYGVISADVFSSFVESNDYVRMYYILNNNGVEVPFYELIGGSALGALIPATPASAIVSGASVQIIIKVRNDAEVLGFLTFSDVYVIDNVSITSAMLYSRKTGLWNDGSAFSGTWSTSGFTGPPCGCVPLDNSVAVIGNGFTVSLPGNQSVGMVDVQSTGTLQYTASGVTLSLKQGLVRVRSGGTINGLSGAIMGKRISFDADLPDAVAMQIDAGGTISINDLVIGNATGNQNYINGEGSLTITNDILINASNTTLTNNLTTTLNANRVVFGVGSTTTGASFINNGNINIAASLAVNDAIDDNNIITNMGTLTFVNVDALLSATGNGADLRLNNSGTINQSGTFLDIPPTASIANSVNNLSGATWNYSGSGHDTDIRLSANNASNTFNYSLNGAQQIITPVAGNGYNNLTLQSSGAKTALSSFSVNGNWLQTGTASFTPATFTVTFNGSGTQTISTALAQTFNNLTLNLNALANTVALNNNITVSGILTLTNGGLNLNGRRLILTNSANAAMSATATGYVISEVNSLPYSWVVWNMGTTIASYTIPFRDGPAGNSIPFIFNKTSAGAGAGSFSISTFHTASDNTPLPAGVLHTKDPSGNDISSLVADRFWMITPSSYTTVPTATVTFNVTNAEQVAGNPTLVAQRWNATSLLWDLPIASQTSTAASAQVVIPGTFSTWTLSASSSPLPIALTDLDAIQLDNQILLNWSTATELNNDFFTVERLNKKDGFDEVGRVSGKGTTKEVSNYEFFDTNPWEGKNYYRLKQTDFDGAYTYSEIVATDFKNRGEAFKVYPNPAHEEDIIIEVRNMKPQQQTVLVVSNLLGMKALQMDMKADDNGSIKAIVGRGTLPNGVYIVNVTSGEPMKRKIIIE